MYTYSYNSKKIFFLVCFSLQLTIEKLDVLYKHNNTDQDDASHVHKETLMKTEKTRDTLCSLPRRLNALLRSSGAVSYTHLTLPTS